jgi:hypothetical protein
VLAIDGMLAIGIGVRATSSTRCAANRLVVVVSISRADRSARVNASRDTDGACICVRTRHTNHRTHTPRRTRATGRRRHDVLRGEQLRTPSRRAHSQLGELR